MAKSRKRKPKRGGGSSRSTFSSRKKSDKKITKAIVFVIIGAMAVAAVLFIAFGRGGSGSSSQAGEVSTPSGLRYVDEVVGTGESPKPGQNVTVHYTGTFENGTKFESSVDSGQPLKFRIGTGAVIKGWDEGIMTMKVGGTRKLIIPPKLGYGAAGSPPKIPPNSTLLFEVQLLGVN